MNEFFNYFFGFDRDFNYESLGGRTYKHISKDNKEILVVNVAGFKKDDLKIETKNICDRDYLYITGTPNEEVKEYVSPMNIRFAIKSNIIESIDGKVEDGMLYLTVTRKDNKPKININF